LVRQHYEPLFCIDTTAGCSSPTGSQQGSGSGLCTQILKVQTPNFSQAIPSLPSEESTLPAKPGWLHIQPHRPLVNANPVPSFGRGSRPAVVEWGLYHCYQARFTPILSSSSTLSSTSIQKSQPCA